MRSWIKKACHYNKSFYPSLLNIYSSHLHHQQQHPLVCAWSSNPTKPCNYRAKQEISYYLDKWLPEGHHPDLKLLTTCLTCCSGYPFVLSSHIILGPRGLVCNLLSQTLDVCLRIQYLAWFPNDEASLMEDQAPKVKVSICFLCSLLEVHWRPHMPSLMSLSLICNFLSEKDIHILILMGSLAFQISSTNIHILILMSIWLLQFWGALLVYCHFHLRKHN